MLEKLIETINYNFKDKFLLKAALTHPSIIDAASLTKYNFKNYEKLEFLGDSVISLIISENLLNKFSHLNEGQLAKLRASLVAKETLSAIAKEINLANFLEMSAGEFKTGGQQNLSNLENCFEAVIGAIFLDGGYSEASKVVTKLFASRMREDYYSSYDPKSELQEWLQANKMPTPEYQVLAQQGAAHNPEFTIAIEIENFEQVIAKAGSKKAAEKAAAKKMLDLIKQKNL